MFIFVPINSFQQSRNTGQMRFLMCSGVIGDQLDSVIHREEHFHKLLRRYKFTGFLLSRWLWVRTTGKLILYMYMYIIHVYLCFPVSLSFITLWINLFNVLFNTVDQWLNITLWIFLSWDDQIWLGMIKSTIKLFGKVVIP